MNKNGTELFYCVERERRARCDAAHLFDRRNNTFTVKKQHVRHDEDFVRSEAFLVRQELKKCSNDGKPREVVDDVRAKFSVVASVACGSYDAKRKIIDTAKGRKEDDVIEMDKGGSIANEFSQTKDGQRFLVKDEQFQTATGSSRILLSYGKNADTYLLCSEHHNSRARLPTVFKIFLVHMWTLKII
ncbi:Protein CBG14006 [Caenorhabditis briggsae]|uniref:Protein CBG14006 n=1 Tax=Caenorhabditis briggsae TaxID=6238 RepID=A8XJ69_CAEBR|nr:Protein CBG14006 [Caenorhabditis briggsae]CAP32694.1 Protein CBG14006 [Caenorhabditis briggsae]